MTDGLPGYMPAVRWQGSDQSDSRSVSARCQRTMRNHVPQLIRMVIGPLRESEPAYRSGTIPPGELQRWIGQSINRALDACQMSQAEMANTLDVPYRTGRRRAQQGVPPRALLRGYHIGGQVLSTAVMQWADAEGLSTQQAAVLVSSVWKVADAHSAAAVAALCSAQAEFPHSHTGSAGYLLDALLNGDRRETTVAAVARAFGLLEQGRYAVIVQEPMPGGMPVQADSLVPYAHGMRLIWRSHGSRAVGVAALGDKTPALLGCVVSGQREHRTGISAALSGLAALGRASQQAESAARTLRGPGLAFFEERFHALLLNANPDLAHEMQWHVLGPVLTLDSGRRQALLRTLEAWLTADGSVAKAATDMGCHRNTVLNRLRRIEQLTNRCLSAPKDLIDLALALEAFRQFSTSATVSQPRSASATVSQH